ncbi:hypothetical protein ACH5RR_027559 [Cinchona calisaya]|uniref:Uncharacterized protein n=1 Tax=Cinchona calisaya TaxID=153742 RepID=A0ABD2Z5S8_9GENT
MGLSPDSATVVRKDQICGVWFVQSHFRHLRRVNYQSSSSTKRRRNMAGGGDGHSTTFKGFTMHQPKRWHVVTGKGMCALMWFWILYRAQQDGPVVLVSFEKWRSESEYWLMVSLSDKVSGDFSCNPLVG